MNCNTNKEIWKDIEGYNGDYQVSNFGNVRSFKYKTARLLKPHYDKKFGYARLILRKDNKSYPHTVHRLVAEAFIDNPHSLSVINHKDENPSNNHVANLEWCTYSYNANYGTAKERRMKNTDYNSVAEKQMLAVACYDLKGNLISYEKSAMIYKREFGFDNSWIAKCCKETKRKAFGFYWRYVDLENVPKRIEVINDAI